MKAAIRRIGAQSAARLNGTGSCFWGSYYVQAVPGCHAACQVSDLGIAGHAITLESHFEPVTDATSPVQIKAYVYAHTEGKVEAQQVAAAVRRHSGHASQRQRTSAPPKKYNDLNSRKNIHGSLEISEPCYSFRV